MTDDIVTDTSVSNPVDINDDLEAFSAEFFETPKEEPSKDDVETEDNPLATDEDDKPEDADPEGDAEPEEEEEDEEPVPEPKKGKKTARERIDELTAKAREAERREQALLKRLEEIEKAHKPEVKTEEAPVKEQASDAPDPHATDKDGEPVYPLGEFDPAYIRALAKYTVAEETRLAKEAAQKEAEAAKLEQTQKELTAKWLERIEQVEEELPDLREKLADSVKIFENVETAYAEYLAGTIMDSEYGPQILYYLSQNIGEAQKIVASGPAAATRAIGRLEARFEKPPVEKKSDKKVSSAPTPPEARTRGSSPRTAVSPDTDDLKAFEREFFGKG